MVKKIFSIEKKRYKDYKEKIITFFGMKIKFVKKFKSKDIHTKKVIFTLNLPVIEKIELSIIDANLASFVERQLKNYIIKKEEKEIVEKCYKSIISCKNENILTKINNFFSKNQTISRKIKIEDNIGYFNNVIYNLQDSTLNISAKREISIKDNLRYSEYHSMFYDLVLFPIFSLYAVFNNYYLLHGSLIKIRDKHILILGLDGVGKSTLSSELEKNNAKILSDNFVLFNGKSAIPFNMVMRFELDQETDLEILYSDDNLKEVLPKTIVNKEINVDEMYLLSISEVLNVKTIDFNDTILSLFLNNAPEIGQANNFLAPFLYNNIDIINKNLNIKFTILGIPKKEINNNLGVILNDS